MSVFVQTSQVVPTIMSADGHVLTQPFLELCRLCIPIVERLGTAFILVKTDISGNIKRLADKASTDPDRYQTLFTIVQDELVCSAHVHGTSCTKGLLWLKRAMEFTVAILLKLQQDDEIELCQAVKETYALTLQRFHGFIASTAFSGCSSAMGLSHATGVHRPRGAAVGSASQESGHQLRPSLPLSLGDRARHVTWWSQVQGRQPVQGGTACACCRAIKVPVAAATTRDTKHPRFVALLCDPDTAPTASAKELTLPSDPPWLGALPMRGNKTAPFITQLSWSGWACVGLIVRVRLHPPPRTAQLAFNFVPTREAFEASLGGDARAGMAQFTTGFGPVLAEVQAFMVLNNLDDPTRV
ncbi:MAG: hypothetical protein WDW36_003534 [Sanguina aurantia]